MDYPDSYVDYISRELWPQINGLPLLVDEEDEEPTAQSLSWAQTLLSKERPDLAKKYLPIRILERHALCFARDQGDNLFEVNLDGESPPADLRLSFSQYLSHFEREWAFVSGQLSHIENRYFSKNADSGEFNREMLRGSPQKEAEDWKLTRSCVHDRVVSILSFRMEQRTASIEVDVFLTSDHPDYQRWNSIQSALSLLFCEARRAGLPPRITFRKRPGAKSAFPFHLKRCLSDLGLPDPAYSDTLAPSETVELLLRLLRLPGPIIKKVRDERKMSLAGLCYLAVNGVWSVPGIVYILQTVDDYAPLLFGKQSIEENPILFLDQANRATNAAAIGFFLDKLRHDSGRELHEGLAPISCTFTTASARSFSVDLSAPAEIPWIFRFDAADDLQASPSATTRQLNLVPSARRILPGECQRILEDLNHAAGRGDCPGVVIYTEDHKRWLTDLGRSNPETLKALLNHAQGLNANICIVPYDLRELDRIAAAKLKSVANVPA